MRQISKTWILILSRLRGRYKFSTFIEPVGGEFLGKKRVKLAMAVQGNISLKKSQRMDYKGKVWFKESNRDMQQTVWLTEGSPGHGKQRFLSLTNCNRQSTVHRLEAGVPAKSWLGSCHQNLIVAFPLHSVRERKTRVRNSWRAMSGKREKSEERGMEADSGMIAFVQGL